MRLDRTTNRMAALRDGADLEDPEARSLAARRSAAEELAEGFRRPAVPGENLKARADTIHLALAPAVRAAAERVVERKFQAPERGPERALSDPAMAAPELRAPEHQALVQEYGRVSAQAALAVRPAASG